MGKLSREAEVVLAKVAQGIALTARENAVMRSAAGVVLERKRPRAPKETATVTSARRAEPEGRIIWAFLEGLKPKDAVQAIREYLLGLPSMAFARSRGVQLAAALRLRMPPVGPVLETDVFVCKRFGNCEMAVRHCLERQGARWPGGNRLKDGSVREKRAGVHPYCSSGDCEQGRDIAARCPFRPEVLWSKGRYRFFREDSHEQRVAAKKQRRETLQNSERGDLSPFQEAALLTRDDPVRPGG